MQPDEIRAEQENPTANLNNLKPIEAALWEIALQCALSNEVIDRLITAVEKVNGRRS